MTAPLNLDFNPNVPRPDANANGRPTNTRAGSGDGGVRDRVEISETGRSLFESAGAGTAAVGAIEAVQSGGGASLDTSSQQPSASEGGAAPTSDSGGQAPGAQELSPEEQQEVEKLKSRDREVRAHEQAHVSALGGEGGSASYSYTTGPDGRRYATGGEVPISISEVAGDPQATIERARKIASAALAPSQPSGADIKAAGKARELEAKARQDLAEQQKGEDGESTELGSSGAPVDAGAGAAADLISTASPTADDHDHAPGPDGTCAVCGKP